MVTVVGTSWMDRMEEPEGKGALVHAWDGMGEWWRGFFIALHCIVYGLVMLFMLISLLALSKTEEFLSLCHPNPSKLGQLCVKTLLHRYF